MNGPSAFKAASCTGKVRLESHGAAYRCKFCRGWHIGNHGEQERSKHEWRRYRQRYEGADA